MIQCRVLGKKSSIDIYGCDKEYIPCISYSKCSQEDGSCKPHTNTEKAWAEDEEGIQMENAEDNDSEDEMMKM